MKNKIVAIFLIVVILLMTGSFAVNAEEDKRLCEYNAWEIVKNAWCGENGLKERVCICGDRQTEIIPATENHVDENHDGICDVCFYNAAVDCGHSCHSNGFFWRIFNFFNRLFKKNHYCTCGKAHW